MQTSDTPNAIDIGDLRRSQYHHAGLEYHLAAPGGGIVVGGATGKGVPAGLVMSTAGGMLRLAAQSCFSPGEMLQRVNEALFPTIPSNMFVTCFYGVLEPKSGRFTYANAGHDLPYLWHGGDDCEELRLGV